MKEMKESGGAGRQAECPKHRAQSAHASDGKAGSSWDSAPDKAQRKGTEMGRGDDSD